MATPPQTWRERITCDPAVHHGEPVIRGTRVAVATLVASLVDLTPEELLQQFPQITREDLEAALLYAAEASRNTLVA